MCLVCAIKKKSEKSEIRVKHIFMYTESLSGYEIDLLFIYFFFDFSPTNKNILKRSMPGK